MSGYKVVTLHERFWSKVAFSDDCWEWQGHKNRGGYGHFTILYKPRLAHRVAFALEGGHIPPTFTLDHLCRNRACVNPAHLEAVPIEENVARTPWEVLSNSSFNGNKTVCVRNHPYDAVNSRRDAKGRRCLTCCRERMRRVRALRREQ